VVVVGEARVDRVDLENFDHTVVGFTGGIADSVITPDHSVVAIDGDDQALHVMTPDSDTFERLLELAPSEQPHEVSLVDGSVVVVDYDRLHVRKLQDDRLLSSNCLPRQSITPIVGTAGSGATDLPVVDQARNELHLAPTGTGINLRCRTLDLGSAIGRYGSPLVEGRTAYVPNWATGEIIRIDLRDRSRTTVPFVAPNIEFQLVEHEGQVWANDPWGRMAALVDVGSRPTLIPKFPISSGGGQESSTGGGLQVVEGDGSSNGVTTLDDDGIQFALASDLPSSATSTSVAPPVTAAPPATTAVARMAAPIFPPSVERIDTFVAVAALMVALVMVDVPPEIMAPVLPAAVVSEAAAATRAASCAVSATASGSRSGMTDALRFADHSGNSSNGSSDCDC